MPELKLPKIPKLPSLRCEDHKTYVVLPHRKQRFIEVFAEVKLYPATPIITTKFPAEHIALAEKPGKTQTCERMVGLSVSDDPESPINKLCALDPGRANRFGVLQHIAYTVDSSTDFRQVRNELEGLGVKFMTDVLEYTDVNNATLLQMFVACEVPYGPFVEIIQRKNGNNGQPFQGFNTVQIDALYQGYDNYSKWLFGRL